MRIRNVAYHAYVPHHVRYTIDLSRAMTAASSPPAPPKRATNVSMAENLLAQAKELRINVSQAAEAGLARAVAAKRAELWLKENQEAIESSNAFVEQQGLPLGKYRMS